MSQVAWMASGSGGVSFNTASGVWFNSLGAAAAKNTTEANAQVPFRGAFTLSNLFVQVSVNARSTPTTVIIRQNGGSTALMVTIPAGTTGVISDIADVVTGADGDLIDWMVTNGTGTGALTISVSVQVGSAGQAFTMPTSGGNTASQTFPTSEGITLAGVASSQLPAAVAGLGAVEAFTASNLRIQVATNTRTTSGAYTSRNLSNTALNQSVSIPAATTGFFEDGANNDSIASTGGFGSLYTQGSGAGSIKGFFAGFKYLGGVANQCALFAAVSSAFGGNTTDYAGPGGTVSGSNATESAQQAPAPYACTSSRFVVYVGSSNPSESGTVVSRVNGVTGAQSCSIPANTTGLFASTGTDTLNAGDLLGAQAVFAGSSNITISSIGWLIAAAGGNATAFLTGVSSTMSAGVVAAAIAASPTGVAMAASAGSIGPSPAAAVSGVASNLAAGADTSAIAVSAAGVVITCAAGSIGIPSGGALTGVAQTLSAGQLLASVAAQLTGVALTAVPGALAAAEAVGVAGVATSALAGVLSGAEAISLAGVSSSPAAGVLASKVAASTAGASSAWQAGNGSGAGSTGLPGVQASMATSAPLAGLSSAIAGVAAVLQPGAFGRALSASLAGVASPFVAGLVGTQITTNVGLVGVAMTLQPGLFGIRIFFPREPLVIGGRTIFAASGRSGFQPAGRGGLVSQVRVGFRPSRRFIDS